MTGLPAAVFQPLRFQPGSQIVIELSISCESVTTTTFEPSGSERRPSSAAVSSIRLLVVCALAAGELDRVAAVGRDDDRRPAAGAGVAAAGAVGPDQRLAGRGLYGGVLAHRRSEV